MKNGTYVTLKVSSNVAGDENNFPYKLSLINVIHKFQRLIKLLQMVHQLI